LVNKKKIVISEEGKMTITPILKKGKSKSKSPRVKVIVLNEQFINNLLDYLTVQLPVSEVNLNNISLGRFSFIDDHLGLNMSQSTWLSKDLRKIFAAVKCVPAIQVSRLNNVYEEIRTSHRPQTYDIIKLQLLAFIKSLTME
jgi:hypothetical protein